MVCPELVPFAKTGACGHGELARGCPAKLRPPGPYNYAAYATCLRRELPAIPAFVPCLHRRQIRSGRAAHGDARAGISVIHSIGDRVLRSAFLYSTPEGDYPDNAERFAFFARGVLEVLPTRPAHVLHAHAGKQPWRSRSSGPAELYPSFPRWTV